MPYRAVLRAFGRVEGECIGINFEFIVNFIIFFCTLACPSGWSEHDGNCYKFFPQQLTWDSARSACINIGGDLALPTSQTNQYISTFASDKGSQQTWVGVFR